MPLNPCRTVPRDGACQRCYTQKVHLTAEGSAALAPVGVAIHSFSSAACDTSPDCATAVGLWVFVQLRLADSGA